MSEQSDWLAGQLPAMEDALKKLVEINSFTDAPEGGRKVGAVLREVFAIDDVCPHMGASLSSGYVEDGIVTCPWHAWRFRLKDGVWADNPRLKVGCYQVRIVEDDVQVMIPDLPEKSK